MLCSEVQDLAQPRHLQILFMPQAKRHSASAWHTPPGLLLDAEKGHFIIQPVHEMFLTAPALWEPVLGCGARKRSKLVAFQHTCRGPGHTAGSLVTG